MFCAVALAALLAPAAALIDPLQIPPLYAIRNAIGAASFIATSWTTGDPCINGWQGIQCDQNTPQNVISIVLQFNSLAGAIPPDICFFNQTLRELVLANNQLTSFPNCGGPWSQLYHLNLNNNPMNQQAPQFGLGNFPALLDLALNGLTQFTFDGNELCSLPGGIQFINVATTNMPSLPECPTGFALPSLQNFQAFSCNIAQNFIPSWLSSNASCSLTFLSLSNNPLISAPLPSFPACSTLQSLYLDNCGLFSAPTNIPQLPYLATLSLKNNPIGGIFSVAPNDFPALTSLDVTDCQFVGQLPKTWLETHPISYAFFNQNFFTGGLPNLFNLTGSSAPTYDFSYNRITEQVPGSWGVYLNQQPAPVTVNLRMNEMRSLPAFVTSVAPSNNPIDFCDNPYDCGSFASFSWVSTQCGTTRQCECSYAGLGFDGSLCYSCPTNARVPTTTTGTNNYFYNRTFSSDGCFSCPDGSPLNSFGYQCEPCPPDTYNIASIHGTTCQPCKISINNQFTPQPNQYGASACLNCNNQGAVYFNTSLWQCTQCPPGTFKNTQTTTTQCTPCPTGRYAGNPGTTTCYQCPEGYSAVGSSGASTCAPCPYGSASDIYLYGETCNTASCHGCFSCPTDTYPTTTQVQNVQSCGSGVGVASCFSNNLSGGVCPSCPTGGICNGGSNQPLPDVGWWAAAPADNFTTPTLFLCPQADWCPGGAYSTCSEQRTGVLCASCVTGYYSLRSTCKPCPPPGQRAIQLIFYIAIFLVAYVLFFRFGGAGDKLVSLSIAVNYYQINAVMLNFSLDWPAPLRGILQFFQFFNLDFDATSPECTFPGISYEEKWRFSVLLPVIVSSVFLLAWLPFYILARPFKSLEKFRTFMGSRVIAGIVLFINLVYLVAVSKALEVFDCTRQPNGVRTLDAYPEIVCLSARHKAMIPGAILASIFYSAGIPLSYLYVLRRGAKAGALGDHYFQLKYGALFMKYKPAYWYWELVVLMRKLMFVIPELFFSNRSDVTSAISAIVLMIAGIFVKRNKPYIYNFLNYFDLWCLTCTLLTLLTGIMYTYTDAPVTIAYGLLMIMIMTLISIFPFAVYEYMHHRKETHDKAKQEGKAYAGPVKEIELAAH
eukprot:TRINITY_DN1501_c0_g1_i1.p1 TRINITY_DN1501_c0_g1~~TRINITY_DN1501_c0_g1_i1.p1  ORF type:complete len:1111 (-),score=242.14 TRINITY_DN1501_c0_g1_i1:113-3445(-)